MDIILVFLGKIILTLSLFIIATLRSFINKLFSIADSISLYFIRYVNKLDKKVQQNVEAYEEYINWYKQDAPKQVQAKRHALGKYATKVAELRTTNRK